MELIAITSGSWSAMRWNRSWRSCSGVGRNMAGARSYSTRALHRQWEHMNTQHIHELELHGIHVLPSYYSLDAPRLVQPGGHGFGDTQVGISLSDTQQAHGQRWQVSTPAWTATTITSLSLSPGTALLVEQRSPQTHVQSGCSRQGGASVMAMGVTQQAQTVACAKAVRTVTSQLRCPTDMASTVKPRLCQSITNWAPRSRAAMYATASVGIDGGFWTRIADGSGMRNSSAISSCRICGGWRASLCQHDVCVCMCMCDTRLRCGCVSWGWVQRT